MATIISGTAGVTFPAGGVGNPASAVVGLTDTQTLTNKTLTTPTLTTPTIDSASVPTVSGTAPLYLCRAWINFNGTGTPAARASGNVTSITDNGTGDYTLNFTTAMPDANFSMVGTTNLDSRTVSISSLSTASARVRTSNTAAALVDLSENCVAIFR